MTDRIDPVFINDSCRIPLLNDYGRVFLGLENTSSPELAERVKALFRYLNDRLGFPDSIEGNENQKHFNVLLRSIYPEVMIDLADLIYAQHERIAVHLNFYHINTNLKKHHSENSNSLENINQKMTDLFYQLARTVIESQALRQDFKIIQLLSESYSYYLYQTKNFPWEDPAQPRILNLQQPVLDVATGLTGFSRVYAWPDNYPQLVLSDNEPFIVKGLSHYLTLIGKKNIVIIESDFPSKPPLGMKFGFIMANKFLHHLQRADRISFFKWAMGALEVGGVLEILDTDLEHHMIEQSRQPEMRNKLTLGYRETLVEIENGFADNLKYDVEGAEFRVTHFDCQEYCDDTDAFSQNLGDIISLKFKGLEIIAEKPAEKID